jgi:hypothetical protein
MKLAASFLVVLAISTIAFSQSAKIATLAQIEAYAKSIDRLMNRHKEPDVIIADVSDYDSDDPKWQRFKTSKELETFRENTETYTIANNWRSNGKLVSSLFTLFSPSGDWAQYVSHYFRPDGSAAKVTTEMRTFNGDYIIIREMYFDPRGKLLKKASKYLDLSTKKPKKPTAEMTDESSESYKADYYKKVSALPFYTLTKRKI